MRRLKCHKAEMLLTRELDEGLESKERTQLEDHLRECPACRKLKQEITTMLEAVASDVPDDPGQEYWDSYYSSLDAKLKEKESAKKWGLGWTVGIATAMAVLMLIFVGIRMLDNTAPSTLSAEKQLAVVQELLKLYGPVNGTYVQNNVEMNELQSENYLTMTLPQDVLVTWFEIEDEQSG